MAAGVIVAGVLVAVVVERSMAVAGGVVAVAEGVVGVVEGVVSL